MYSRQVSSFREKLNSRILRPVGTKWGRQGPWATAGGGVSSQQLPAPWTPWAEQSLQGIPKPLPPWAGGVGVWGPHPRAGTRGHDLHAPPCPQGRV